MHVSRAVPMGNSALFWKILGHGKEGWILKARILTWASEGQYTFFLWPCEIRLLIWTWKGQLWKCNRRAIPRARSR